MDAQVQPHTIARTQHAPKGASDASKPGGSSSSAAGAPGQRVRNLLDHVLGDGVVPWSVEAGDDPTGLAAAAAAAGGVKVDADQMQQYGISQVGARMWVVFGKVALPGPSSSPKCSAPLLSSKQLFTMLSMHGKSCVLHRFAGVGAVSRTSWDARLAGMRQGCPVLHC